MNILRTDGIDIIPVGIYLLKVSNRDTRKRCGICSKLTIKTPERREKGKGKRDVLRIDT